MLKINNTKVYGLEESVIASGYPKVSNDIVCKDIDTISDDDYTRAKNLGKVKSGSGHDCYLKGVTVQADVRFPLYWLKQFQRYHFADIVSSQSTMHCITKMNIRDHCNEWVDEEVINIVKKYVYWYNHFDGEIQRLKNIARNSGSTLFEEAFDMHIEMINIQDSKGNNNFYNKKDLYMKIISNLPSGFEMTMRITTNYLQLKTIYFQRKNHKLPDWEVFCDWILKLPMFKELVLGENTL